MSFFLDRDDDDFGSALVQSDHVIYTKHSDIEAEIFANGDAYRAVATAFGLAYADVRRVGERVGEPLSALATLWRDWIRLRLIAMACDTGAGARFAQTSKIHAGAYGTLDDRALESLTKELSKGVDQAKWETDLARVDAHINAAFVTSQQGTLVKGKWIAGYLRYVVKAGLPDEQIRTNVRDHSIIVACLSSIDFDGGSLAAYYKPQIARALAA
ncbi:hypothetical protein GCM10009748_27290 [Agromyces lapidis]